MTDDKPSELLSEVVAVLRSNGYAPLARSQTIGGVALEVEGLWEGPKATLDLSLVGDRPSSREDVLRLHWRVQSLARALDAAQSRRTLTVILVGIGSTDQRTSDLLELARLLVVDGSLPVPRMLAPLLPLRLPATAATELDGLDEVASAVERGSRGRELAPLVRVADDGASAVTERYLAWLDQTFNPTNKSPNE